MAGSAATTEAKPPRNGKAATRSPSVNSLPTGADRTRPATSEPGTNGRSGVIWYWPRVSSTSGKQTPAAATSTTTFELSVGSGRSSTSTAAGPSRLVTMAARMPPS